MNTLIIMCIISLIITWFIEGFNIVSLGATITTALFCSRKIGHFCKMNTLLVIEGISIFLSSVWQILFKSFSFRNFLITLLIRLIFLSICYYDKKNYVYVKEIHRKE